MSTCIGYEVEFCIALVLIKLFLGLIIIMLIFLITEWCTKEEDNISIIGKYVEGIVGAVHNPGLQYGVAKAKDLSRSTQAAIVTASGKWLVQMDVIGRYVEGIVGAVHNPGLQYGVAKAKHLSKSTQAAIVTASGKWLVRMDLPHGKTNFPHININYCITNIRDPHIPIPKAVVRAAGATNEIIRTVADWAHYAAIAVDGYRLITAKPEELTKVAGSVAGGYAGAYGGAYAGSTLGGYIGGTVGAIFGGVVVVPSIAVGSMIGGFLGAMKGSQIGSKTGEEMAS